MNIQCIKCEQQHNDIKTFPLLELDKYVGKSNSLICKYCIENRRMFRKLLRKARRLSSRSKNSAQEIRQLQILLTKNQDSVFEFPFKEIKRTREYMNKFLLREYGITIVHYTQLLEKQNWQCGICHKQFPKTLEEYLELEKLPLVVDHDHKTNIIRGLLCHSHNSGLGFFQDSPELLRQAASYIEKSTSNFVKTKLSYKVRKLITEQKVDAFDDYISIQNI